MLTFDPGVKDSKAKPVEIVVNMGEIVDIQVEMRLLAAAIASPFLVLSRRRRGPERQNRAHNYSQFEQQQQAII